MLDWLAYRAKVSPQKIAIIYGDQRISYGQLNHQVAGMANRLATIGVGSGKHVGVLMANRVEYICLIHALARVKAVLIPLNTRLAAREIEWQLLDAHCDYVICSSETEIQASPHASPQRQVWSVDAPNHSGVGDFTGVSEDDARLSSSHPFDLDAVQGIIYTSGTTGQPKGATLTYSNHFWSATASSYRLGIQNDDRWLLTMPLYHVGGLAIVLRSCLYGTAIVLQDGFEADAVNDALDNRRITLLSVVPTMLGRLLDSREEREFASTLRCVLVGGAAAPAELVERCLALNVPIALTYGLTEAASQVATALAADVRRNPQSVGKPLMFTEVRIIGNNGEELPAGETGEIVVKGPGIMRGYYGNPEATKEALKHGKLYTGDVGYLDEEDNLWIVQRRSDLIVSGGENVYPAEVEQILLGHPGVRDVCVVGIDDAEWGQRVVAVVVPGQLDITPDDLLAFCRKHLAGFKIPRTIHFIDALPRTSTGKLQREAVAESVRRNMALETSSNVGQG